MDIRKINNEKFYYFIPGTSKIPKTIKVKILAKEKTGIVNLYNKAKSQEVYSFILFKKI